jgi:thiosulfate dehydrogenase (quinone) large subunit
MTTTTAPVVTEKHTDSWYHDFVPSSAAHVFGGITRILLGFVFLWAFLDKNFGWGMATAKGQGWMFGTGDGDPTFGFLKFGTNPDSAWAAVFTGLRPGEAPDPMYWTNWLFMAGLLGIGLALVLGVFMRIATISGVVLLFLMYLAEAPIWIYNVVDPKTGAGSLNNPLIDDHIVYGFVLVTLMLLGAERWLGLGKKWESLSFVKKHPWLA